MRRSSRGLGRIGDLARCNELDLSSDCAAAIARLIHSETTIAEHLGDYGRKIAEIGVTSSDRVCSPEILANASRAIRDGWRYLDNDILPAASLAVFAAHRYLYAIEACADGNGEVADVWSGNAREAEKYAAGLWDRFGEKKYTSGGIPVPSARPITPPVTFPVSQSEPESDTESESESESETESEAGSENEEMPPVPPVDPLVETDTAKYSPKGLECRDYEDALKTADGNVTQAAKSLGISRGAVHHMIRKCPTLGTYKKAPSKLKGLW